MSKEKKKKNETEMNEQIGNTNVFELDERGVKGMSLQDFADALVKPGKDIDMSAKAEKPALDIPEDKKQEQKSEQKAEQKPDERNQKIAELEGEVKRLVAENRNQKTRLENDFRIKMRYALENFFREFINIRDDFEKAMSFAPACEKESQFYSFIEGVRHLESNIDAICKRYEFEKYSSLGTLFDPNLHQAMRIVDVEGRQSNEIVTEHRKGYKFGDRILRPAMVEIASGAQAAKQDESAPEPAAEKKEEQKEQEDKPEDNGTN